MFEQLERREMMVAAIWHNLAFPVDVNGDRPSTVDPLDVLTLVNEINAPRFSHPITRQLPRQSSQTQRSPFLDPDCDGAVSALDVLMVVNYINTFGAGGGGRPPTSGGTYANAACSPQLLEGTDFATELTRVLHVPSDNKILRVQFESPVFDTLSQQQIRDAFEIEVVDSAGRPVVLPYAPDRDASFNWSEGGVPAFGSGTWSVPSSAGQSPSVSFDLSGLASGTEIHVLARLVNNDSDANTNVLIRGYEFVGTPAGTPGSAAASTFSAIASRSAPIELPKLNDISGNVLAEYGRTSLSGDNNELLTELKLTNIGSQTALAPIVVVLDHFSDLDANAMRPDGILPDGRPFFDLTSQLVGQSLKAGESIRSREIRFLNDSGNRFTYGMKVFGKLNSAPSQFTSQPNTSIEAGKAYRYQPAAKDDDGDIISYSVIAGPDAMEVESRTGMVTWNTQPSDVGTHRVTIRATDPHGLFLDQTFDLQVVASLQNRPPNFVTDPVTDAIASSGFEITTVATGAQPAGVDVVSGFRGPRLVSINAGDQSVSVHAGQKNDRFDDTTVYSTGEPRPTGAAIDVGYGVDVGLPPFLVPGDRNNVLGMDQGDLNGDGILDLVVITARDESTKPQGQEITIEITRVLGDGDGNFGSPTVIATFPTSFSTNINSLAEAKNLRIADIDGDGRLDVVALQETSPRLVTIRGLGDGSFQPAVFTTLSTPLNDYRLVDLDQDGNVDIVGRTESFVDLSWMRGAGNGTFAPFVRLAAGGGAVLGDNHSRPYDFADIDGDGDIDIVNSEANSGNIVILLNDGSENFTIGATIDPPGGSGSTNEGSYVLHVADFTGDNRLDIFAISSAQERVDLFVGDGTGLSFTHQVGSDAFRHTGNLAGSDRPVDIDGDGDLDIILANNFSGEPISPQVFSNDGTGRFSRTDYPMADFPGHILATGNTNRDTVRGAMFGDYNRDGVIDFSYMTTTRTNFVGNYDFNGVGIRLGTRPGEFGATRTIGGMTQDRNDDEVHAADFNRDGKIDLLSLSNARMSLGNGDGTFQPSFPATSISAGLDNGVVADFNLDGIPDYVASRAAGSFDRKIYVALGNGDGTFDATIGPVSPGQFYQYTDIRAADFNNDGYPDLIAKASVERFIDVYLNSPTSPGTFTRSFRTVTTVQGVLVAGYEQDIATGDFDSDGNTDFVTVDQVAGQPQKLQTFSGDGTGNFTVTDESFAYDDAMFSEFNFYYPYVLQSGDVNSDGHLDVVSFSSYGFIIHIGDGNGAFTSVDHYPIERINAARAKSSFLIDFDQDGHLDLVNHGFDETLSIRLGKGDGTFAEPQRVDTVGSGDILTFADFDNDSHLDMAVVMTFAGNYNNEDVVFYYGTRNGLVDQLAVDLDGDGNEEILAINEANDRLKIFTGDNLDRLNRRNDLLTGRAPQAVATGDLNSDGSLEIITANRAGRSISVFSGSLASGYTSTEILVGSAPIDVLARDINGDGHTDVLVLDEVANAVWVLTGSVNGTLSAPVAIALGDKPGKFTIADATGDGQLDAVITLPDSNRLMILSGIGFQPVAAPIYISLSDSPSDIQVTDLNADGNPDLATTLPGSNVLSVLYGRGNNQFARAQNISVGKEPTRVTLADADEDGRMDLIVANSGDNTASVIYNRFDPNEVYRYDSDAIDPDDDPITYSIVDGPGGLIINSQTGALLWAASPDQVGEHTVTISANDGRGGTATQSFKIDVQPARDNAAPLIATEPSTKIGAGETFTYQATALDNDRDTLRYSLIDAPPGATIDPTTGKVTWDARADMALSFAPHGINSRGNIEIEAHPSLQPTSLTAEGWYNFTGLPASNGRSNIISSGVTTNSGTTYKLFNFGNASLRLEIDYPSPTAPFTYSIPYVPTANRWTHFAITIDDSTRAAKIYVDGVERGSTTIPSPLIYNPTANAWVGDSTIFFTRAIVDNYRLWNVVRTPAEIAEGLSRQYNGDTRVVLDYRFDEPQTLTVRDFSPAGNHGYRKANGLLPVFVPGLAETGSHQFTIGVDDGRGGSDQQSFTLDILPELRGTIRGQAFSDLDGSGARNGTEPVMAGVHLFVDSNGNGYPDPSESQTTTDANGNYQFNGLLPGQYPLKVSPVAGFKTPQLSPVAVCANINTQVDMAIEQLALSQIRGQLRTEDSDPIAYWKVFADLDLDNERDENEPMAMSDRNGNYALTGLNAGIFTIRTELPAGWVVATGTNGQSVTLAANGISEGTHFTLKPTNTSVTGGVHFATSPVLDIEARQTFRYASVAIGIHNEPITYDMSLAPDGMSIDPATGLVAWRPTIAQVGEHLVILRATSASGSISLHDFTLTVTAPNTTPTLSSPEPMGASPGFPTNQPQGSIPGFPPAYVNLIYAVDLQAQDAESHPVTFQLLTGPSGATLNPTTGQLRWTPTLSDVGNAAFSIELRDSQNTTSIINVNIPVLNSQPSATPFAISLPRTQVGLGQDYLARIQGQDSLGRPLTWSLVTGPTGLIVSSTGTLRWTPGNDDLGSHGITVRATNVDGATEDRTFTLQVLGRPVNVSPSIPSEPITSTVIGRTYRYAMQATDSDTDPLSFALIAAPSGMSIHPSLGTILWTPAGDQLGESEVSIQVTDPNGASATQSFKLKVSRSGGPPAIRSVPPTEAAVGAGYLYTIAARDAENDPLIYRLLAAPAGMSIVKTTGEISWTPAVDQVGLQDVVIEVSDGIGGAVTQAFVIRVATGVPNLPPVINSTAPRFGSVGTLYTYTVQATDPESTTITYSLGQSPVDMSIDPVTGVVQWTPTQPFVGKSVVTLIATDANGGKAIESFELDVVAANSQPSIASTAPLDVAAGALFTYQVLGRDTDLDQLIYTLTTAPVGATIDTFGKITWPTSVSLIGPHNFAVRVSDPRGGVTTQSFTLSVIADVIPPKVSLIESLGDANRNILPWQGPFVVYVRAIDNVAVRSLTLKANGRDIPLNAAGTATFTFEDWRFQSINATATAVDTNGNITSRTINFDYDFPEGWGGAGTVDIPTVAITSPTDTSAVFGMVTITGIASHADFAGYKLSYRRIDETTFTEFHESTTAVVNGTLGVWDTSLLINDEYVIRLEAASNAGVVNVVEHNVGLSGELKLGNFRLSFTDMVIPVAGIPIEITRIYDTLQADREGDFGYGWRLEYRNTDLRVGLPKSGLEDIGIYTPLRPGVKVYLNVPGVGRQGFTFNPEIRTLPGFGSNNNLALARPRFTPDRGVTSTLSTGTSNYLLVNEQGELFAPGGIPYNPASPDFGGAYVLTTRDGATYRINGDSGMLETVLDRNNNRIVLGETEISGSSGIHVDIARDQQGRVTSISTSDNIRLNYKYKDGDLVEYIDAERNATSFVYDLTRAHYLKSVIDPLERTGLRLNYDDQGRLVQTILANGATVTTSYDPDNSIRTITDPMGNTSIEEFDAFGNIVSTTNALSGIIKRTHDASGNETSITDELGRTTSTFYNQRGDAIKITDPAGNSTIRRYSALGDLQGETDRVGHTTTNTFDERGNLVRQTNPLGINSNVVYNSSGNVVSLNSVTGHPFEIKRQVGISDSVRINGVGTTEIAYDSLGLPRQIKLTEDGSTESVVVVAVERDATGRQIRREYADGGVELFEYSANGNLIRRTNPNGNSLRYVYDELDRLVETIYPDSTKELRTYSPAGLVTSITDRGGRKTEYEYDPLGRRITTIYPRSDDGSSNGRERREYDIAGQLTAIIDPLENRRQFVYDLLGNTVEEIDALGHSLKSEFDAVGGVTRQRDQLGNATKYSRDFASRVIEVNYADGSKLKNQYDPFGNLIRSESANGAVTLYEYDAQNGLTKVTNALGQSTSYERNARGLITKTIDALGRETTLKYDLAGKLISRTLPDGASDRLEYDPAGNLIQRIGYSGKKTTYSYDSMEQIIRMTFDDGVSREFQYSPTGKPTSIREGDSVVQFRYDTMDRLTAKTDLDGQTISYVYDLNGNLQSLDSIGGLIEYTYNARNELVRVESEQGSTTYAYDAAGRQILNVMPNGVTESRSYDARSRVSMQHFTNGQGSLGAIKTEYDTVGHIIARIDSVRGISESFDYDPNSQLVWHLTESAAGKTEARFSYDAAGNRMTRFDSGKGQTTYTYDDRDRLIREDSSEGVVRHTYDRDGNLIAKDINSDTRVELRWDTANRLVQTNTVKNGVSQVVQYRYSPDGERYSDTQSGITNRWIVDTRRSNSAVLAKIASDSSVTVFVRPADGLSTIAIVTNGSAEFIGEGTNHTVVFMSDSQGNVAEKFAYTSYGEQLNVANGDTPPIQFNGEFRDSNGFDYLRSRYYDSSTGRFVSMDVFSGFEAIPSSQNRYSFAQNDPISRSDPSGFFTLTENQIAIGIIAGMTGAGAIYGYARAETTEDIVASMTFYAIAGFALGVATVVTGPTGLATATESILVPETFVTAAGHVMTYLVQRQIVVSTLSASALAELAAGSIAFSSVGVFLDGILYGIQTLGRTIHGAISVRV